MKLLGIEVTFEEFDNLMCEQSKGKELVVENGKIIARDRVVTENELLNNELNEIDQWFTWYDNQVAQYNRCQRLGVEFDRDINELDSQATINQNRIREIKEKLKIG